MLFQKNKLMSPQEQFNKFGALLVKDVVSKELSSFMTHVMLRAPAYGVAPADEQVNGAVGRLDHEYMFDTLLERVWPYIEGIIGEELLPTYTYGRVYTGGNKLAKHTDREACEISVTVQLARSHHYAWPIYMGGRRFDLAEGDGVIYKGCDIEHWRNVCDAPEGYVSGQVFLHFVRKHGVHANHYGDKRSWTETTIPFIKGRNLLLENK